MVPPKGGTLNATIKMDNNIHLFKYDNHYTIPLNSIISNEVLNDLPKEEKEEVFAYNINQNTQNEKKEIESDNKEEKENENEQFTEVQEWLTNIVKLPEYYKLFEEDGYDELEDIKSITDKE
eukprot:357274_1